MIILNCPGGGLSRPVISHGLNTDETLIMITFKDGPLKGQRLQLQRAPLFLRGVTEGRKPFDALDKLDDVASQDEKVHAYMLTGPVSYGFTDGKNYSGPAIWGEYVMVVPQPSEEDLRNNDRWAKWVVGQVRAGKVPEWV